MENQYYLVRDGFFLIINRKAVHQFKPLIRTLTTPKRCFLLNKNKEGPSAHQCRGALFRQEAALRGVYGGTEPAFLQCRNSTGFNNGA